MPLSPALTAPWYLQQLRRSYSAMVNGGVGGLSGEASVGGLGGEASATRLKGAQPLHPIGNSSTTLAHAASSVRPPPDVDWSQSIRAAHEWPPTRLARTVGVQDGAQGI